MAMDQEVSWEKQGSPAFMPRLFLNDTSIA